MTKVVKLGLVKCGTQVVNGLLIHNLIASAQ